MADTLAHNTAGDPEYDGILTEKMQDAWGSRWGRYQRAVTAGNIDVTSKIEDEVKAEATRKADLEYGRRRRFIGQVATNPRGWGDAPPPSPFRGEIRSANTPMGDAVAQATGSPLAGRVATSAENVAGRVVDTAYNLTGVPAAAQAGENLAAGVDAGDPIKTGASALQLGLMSLPAVGPAARAAFATVPRAVGTTLVSSAAPVFAGKAVAGPSEAREGGSEASDPDARLQQLLTQRASLDHQRAAAIANRDAERYGRGGRKAGKGEDWDEANREVGRLSNEITALDKMIDRATQESSPEFKLQMQKKKEAAEAEKKAKEAATPFRERFPEIAGILPSVGLSLSAGLPLALRTVGNVRSWLPGSYPSRLSSATRKTERAIASGDPKAATAGAKRLQSMIESKPGVMIDAAKAGAAAAAGGALTAEANMFPDQYDAFNLPEGEAKEKARAKALDIPSYLERGVVGTLTGLSGYKAGDLIPKRTPDIDRAKAAAGILSPNYLDDVQNVTRNLRGEPQNLLAEAQKVRVLTKDKHGRLHDEKGYFTSLPKPKED